MADEPVSGRRVPQWIQLELPLQACQKKLQPAFAMPVWVMEDKYPSESKGASLAPSFMLRGFAVMMSLNLLLAVITDKHSFTYSS